MLSASLNKTFLSFSLHHPHFFFSQDSSLRKKSKRKKKRNARDIERSSGDSDSQALTDEYDGKVLVGCPGDQSQSGVDADSESQGSRESTKEKQSPNKTLVTENAPDNDKVCYHMFMLGLTLPIPKVAETLF